MKKPKNAKVTYSTFKTAERVDDGTLRRGQGARLCATDKEIWAGPRDAVQSFAARFETPV
jgi:hypothetical protein